MRNLVTYFLIGAAGVGAAWAYDGASIVNNAGYYIWTSYDAQGKQAWVGPLAPGATGQGDLNIGVGNTATIYIWDASTGGLNGQSPSHCKGTISVTSQTFNYATWTYPVGGTWSGYVPPPVTNYYGGFTVTNDSAIYRKYYVQVSSNGIPLLNTSVDVAPFSTFTLALTNNSNLTWSYYVPEGPSGAGQLTPVTATTNVPPGTVMRAQAPGDLVPLAGSSFNLSNPPVTLPPTGIRSNDFSSTSAAAATAQANDDQRLKELLNLLVAQTSAQRQEANAAMNQAAQAQKQTHDDLTDISDALNGDLDYDSSLKGGSNLVVSTGLYATNFAISDWSYNKAQSWLPAVSGLGSAAPTFTVPMSALGVGGLSDVSLSLGDANLSGWTATIRGFFLLMVSVGFLIASFQIIRGAAPN